jgi:hypothetical protein
MGSIYTAAADDWQEKTVAAKRPERFEVTITTNQKLPLFRKKRRHKMLFSKDIDLAVYEPEVCAGLHLRSQAVCGGTDGMIMGTQFSAAMVDFVASRVAPGNVLRLESTNGTLAGNYEIAEVIDAGSLRVTIMRTGDDEPLVPIAGMSGLTWRIVRYDVQAGEAMLHISARLGLRPGCAGADYGLENVTNPESLRQASVFGTLALIFEAMDAGAQGQEVLAAKAAYYRKRFDAAMENARVLVDITGDGTADRQFRGGQIRLKRQ